VEKVKTVWKSIRSDREELG